MCSLADWIVCYYNMSAIKTSVTDAEQQLTDLKSELVLYFCISKYLNYGCSNIVSNMSMGFFFVLVDKDSSTDAEMSKLIHIKQAGA